MQKVVAVDSGKYATKSIFKTENGKLIKNQYRTKMDNTNESETSDLNSCVVKYKDYQVILGHEAETVNYDTTKSKMIHKIATLSAIARYVEQGDDVIVSIGCPISVFNNVEERAAYQKFMGEGEDVTIYLNGQKKNFTIKKVVVCPESSGIIYKNIEKYKGALVGIIDIGGLNTNCCVYDKLAPIKSTAFTTNLGANVLRNDLKQRLNSEIPGANIQDWQMEDIITKGFIKSHKEKSAEIISEHLKKHIQNILEETKKKGWDIRNLDLVFVGGGSKLLKTEILNIINDAEISENAEWDNAEGFLRVGEANAKR